MLFVAMMYCAVFMPCFVIAGVIFSRPSDNPFERILGWCTLGMAVFINAIGQMMLDQPLVYSWPEPLPSWSVLVQVLVGVALALMGLCGVPAAKRSCDDLARSILRDLRRKTK